MNKLSLSLAICLLSLNISYTQVNPDIMKSVYANIKGFELHEFLQDSEAVKTDIIVNKIKELDLECEMSFEEIPTNLTYPKNGYQLFGFRRKGIICDELMKTNVFSDGRDYNIFLIALDTSTSKEDKPIKYISGQMFLDNVSADFDLDSKISSSYIDYIKLRMFDLQVDDLKFLNKENGILYYQGYSNFEKGKLKIAVDTNTWNNEIEIEKWF